MTKLLISSLLGLVSIQTTAAVPTVYPEVIPGPGLPSLAELNLTSAQLLNMGPPDAALLAKARRQYGLAGRAAAYNAQCGPNEEGYTSVVGIMGCVRFLQQLGTTRCKAETGGYPNRMCSYGKAQIIAYSESGTIASSYCSDVALAVVWTVDHCTRPDNSCSGWQAANGNGDLIIGTVSVDYPLPPPDLVRRGGMCTLDEREPKLNKACPM